MSGIVYYIFNIESGKGYVGKHCKPTPDGRVSAHSRSNSLIGNAIRKYSLSKFKVVILVTHQDENYLLRQEIYWIDRLETLAPSGYNLQTGGQGLSGYKQHELTNEANSLSHRGVPWSEARRRVNKPTRPNMKRLNEDQLKFIDENPNLTKWQISEMFKVHERVARDARNGKYPRYTQ
jgi:GIY-YIG catalytic domain